MANLMRKSIVIVFAALIGASASIPSYAAQRTISRNGTTAFDGAWSVVMQTTQGNCPATVRAGVHILGGHLLAEDQSYGIDGRVAPSGVVRVTVSAAGQSGGAFGHLSRAAGRGRWQTQSGECSGAWTAARRD
jgi:hypothetical protein